MDEQSGELKGGMVKPSNKNKQNSMFKGLKKANINEYKMNSGGASRFFYCAKASPSERDEGLEDFQDIQCQTGCAGSMPFDVNGKERDRFKKTAKNMHPNVKPLKLMEYLIKLVMPHKDGILLDPFAGSGSTIVAAQRLGFKAIGIEKESEYCEIARARLLNAKKEKTNDQMDLFSNSI